VAQGPPGPPRSRSGSRTESGSHPADNSPRQAAETIAAEDDLMLCIVRQRDERRHDNTRRRRLPVAFASQAAPCANRTRWAVMYQCGACGGTHFGRSPVELTTGKRLARCGRVVWLVVARTYRGAAA
jgi:hypothetical protein